MESLTTQVFFHLNHNLSMSYKMSNNVHICWLLIERDRAMNKQKNKQGRKLTKFFLIMKTSLLKRNMNWYKWKEPPPPQKKKKKKKPPPPQKKKKKKKNNHTWFTAAAILILVLVKTITLSTCVTPIKVYIYWKQQQQKIIVPTLCRSLQLIRQLKLGLTLKFKV